ncbi:MAG: cytochrome c oxidase accessory protein CcoG [Campylobacteraceae bacterium]
MSYETHYRKKRYIVFAVISLIIFILPFIRVGGNHLFLLSFDKKQFQLMFTVFDMQELYLIPFLLILLFIGVFFLTTLGGRIWCGWSCPQTIFRVIFRDFIQTKLLGLRKSIDNKQRKIEEGHYFKKILAVVLFTSIALMAVSNFLWYFIPPEDFFVYIKDPANHKIVMGILTFATAFLVFDVVFLKENFCIYVCPYARIQSVMYDEDTLQTIYDENRGGLIFNRDGSKIGKKPKEENAECIGCEACVKVCPTHIDIRKGMQLECINCLECADACSEVMDKLNKPSLVSWASPNSVLKRQKVKLVRARTIGYSIALCAAFVALLIMGTTKEYMLLNINRTTQLFEISNDKKSVENAYVFLFQNTDSKDHTYYFEVSNPDITIKRPNEEFLLKAGQKAKKIVILQTDKILANNDREPTPIHVTIKAFAVDDKDKIFVLRETVFFYPKTSEIPAQ